MEIVMAKAVKKQTNITKGGDVRIIAGRWRGRKLPVLNSQGLRPTGDRIKETLFNWLMGEVAGSRCLDCFAGSGSLGLEALSRGAECVVFCEKEKAVAQQLSKNLAQLKVEEKQAEVKCADSLQLFAQKSVKPFDLIFIDPPFHFNLAHKSLELLEQNQWIAPNAYVYIETEKGQSLLLPEHWHCEKEKTTGQVTYRLYRYLGTTV